MADGDSYSWIGGTAGTWGTAANWEDLTTGTVAAIAPGIDNDATIGAGVTVYGTGSAATLTTIAQGGAPPAPVTLAGDLNVGTLVAEGYLSVTGTLSGDDITLGQVMNGPGYFFSNSVLYGDGTIEAVPGGTITLFADSSGTNTFQLDGNATILALPNVFPGLGSGVSIVLNGTNNAIEIASTYEGQPSLSGTAVPTISTPIQGFNPTDQIDFGDTAFRATAFSDGTLTLTGTGASQTLYFAGNYTGDTFEVSGGVVTVVPDALLPDSYSWIGGTAGVWNNAANWEDLTAGTVAAVAPGIANAVTIAGTVALSGNASATSLTILGDETVFGTINTGTLVLAGGASISALDGATIEAGGITISASIVSGITVDATSVIEMGNSATGAAGALTIDPGNTLSGAVTLAANVVDNGLIVGAPVIFDNGLITGVPEVGLYTDDSLSGTGTIEVPADGAMAIGETVAGAGLTFQLDGNALLVLDAPIGAGNTIDLLGNGNTISIPAGQQAVGATIGGFNSSDVIYVTAETFPINIYGAYTSSFYFDNTLTLTAYHLDLSQLVYTLNIPGNYASDAFQLTTNGLGQDITLSPTATNTDSYSWIGGTAGTWGTASNWEDLTTGVIAGIAPGIGNDATIGLGVTIYGTGSAASLTMSSAGTESETIAADLNVGTLVSGDFLTLDAGTISGSDMTIGYVTSLASFGTPQAPGFGILPAVSGPGTIEVLAGGTLNLDGDVSGGGTTFQLDGDATMVALGYVVGGNTIAMDGSGNTLDIIDIYNGATNFFNPGPPQIDATITGFNTTDVIATDWIGDTPTAVAYANGTLSLAGPDGTENLSLAGNYSGDTFVLNDGAISVVPTAALTDAYSWIGGTAGAWTTASNWEDVTTGTVAAVAPGIGNSVSISLAPQFLSPLIEGNGASASLAFVGGATITGDLTTGTLSVAYYGGAPVDIGTAATISANTATIDGSLTVSGSGASLLVSGLMQGDADSQISATDGGRVQTASLVLDANRANISVDATSVFEVGSAGTGAVGALTIDPGATLSSPGSPTTFPLNQTSINTNVVDNGLIDSAGLVLNSGTLSGTGMVEVAAGGAMLVADQVTTPSLSFELDDNATLVAETAFTAGNVIAMNGTGDELNLAAAAFMNAATVTGFNTTDVLVVEAALTSDTYTSGTLTLLNGTSIVAVVNLAGDYTGDSFQIIQQSSDESLVYVIQGSGATSPGTTGQDSYVWTAPASGFWQDASNWDDITAGQTPAIVAPGSLDLVSITGTGTVYGNGSAASLTIPANSELTDPTLAGTFTTDTLTDVAGLNIASGAEIVANTATIADDVNVFGTLLVSGVLQLNEPPGSQTFWSVFAEYGYVQAGSLFLNNAAISLTGNIEIGNAGTPTANALTIDPGATLSGAGSLYYVLGGNEPGAIGYGAIVDNGLITSDNLTIGQIEQNYTYPLTPEHGAYGPGYQFYRMTFTVGGTGTVEVQTGGVINLQADVVGSGLTFQLDGSATLNTFGSLAAGNTITMNGGANTLTVVGLAMLPYEDYVPNVAGYALGFPIPNGEPFVPSIGATIYGFDVSDQIVLEGFSFNAASYSDGDLVLLQGTTTVDALALSGDYASDTFMVTQTSAHGVPEEIVTIATDSYSWIGGTAGTWGTATNWEDLSTGTVAAVAPGIGSSVTIAGTVTVSGTGSAASLSILGSDTVAVDLNLHTFFVGSNDNLTINAGNTVSAATATDAGMITVDGTGSALVVSGPVQVTEPGLTATNGGLIQIGGLIQQTGTSNAGGYALDGGTIEIGNAGSALAGDLTIDPGYTVSGNGGLYLAGTINTPSPDVFEVFDNGLITSGSLQIGSLWQSSGDGATTFTLPDTLTGYGTVYVQAGGAINVVAAVSGSGLTFDLDNGASLNLFGPVAAGNTIVMKGVGDSLNIGNTYQGQSIDEALAPVVAATILDFSASDRITFQDYGPGDAAFDTASFNNGTLSLLNGTSTFATLDLAGGDYTEAVFSVTSLGDEQVVTVSGDFVACFRAGTRIRTPHGEVAVEQLRPGDQVEAQLGAAPTAINWIGYRTIDCTRHPQPEKVWPVRISAGAFGPNVPCRDLFLSPDHAVFARDVLIPVKHLINGTSVQQVPMDEVTYYHLELPRHDVVLAEGLPAESYLDTGDRSNFANGGGTLRLFPDFSTHPQYASGYWEAFGCAPLVVTGPALAAVRQQLEARVRRAAAKPRKAARARRQASG